MNLWRIFKRKPPQGKKVGIKTPTVRGYDAARESPFLQGWNGDAGVSPNMVRSELPIVRAKCRNLAYNEPIIQRALQLYRSNVVGPRGIAFSADVPTKDGKGIDLDASDTIEKAWRLWADSPEYCDVEGRSTLTGILQAACDSIMRDGEALIALRSNADNPFGFAVKLLPVDCLATNLVRQSSQGRTAILNGVELDANGRPIAYHLYSKVSMSGTYHGQTTRIPANRIIHVFRNEYPGATRGFPVFAPVLNTVKAINAYREAEIVAARLAAMRSGGTYELDSGAIDPTQVASSDSAELYQQVSAGEIRVVPYGYHFKEDGTPAHPNGAYGAFVKNLLQQIASGLNLSYNTLASDLEGVTYSSIRSGVLEDREAYKCLQELLIASILRPMFRRRGAWLDCWLLKGKSGFSINDAERLRLSDTWIPRRWPWVDPLKDLSASKIGVEMGWETSTSVSAEMGNDFYTNIQTMKQENEWKRRNGITMPTEAQTLTPVQNEIEIETESEDEEESDDTQ